MIETKPDHNANQRPGQKPQPVAVCTRCGTVSYSMDQINGQCAQVTAGKRCTGVNGRALSGTDWEACPACVATGTKNEKRCGQCDGAGWLYVRKR